VIELSSAFMQELEKDLLPNTGEWLPYEYEEILNPPTESSSGDSDSEEGVEEDGTLYIIYKKIRDGHCQEYERRGLLDRS
jgi:hypothetical protein